MRILFLGLMIAGAALAAPNFSKDVAPILYKNCVTCHRAGDMAPMSLMDYKSARPWAKAIRQAVVTRKMPPWFADPQYGHFANDTRLPKQDIETIEAWVDGGAVEGNPKDLPPQPVFAEGWKLGKPDIVIDIGEDFQVPPGDDVQKVFTVPTNFTEGKWVRAAEILPGNRKLVHHVHVSLIADRPDGTPVRKKQERSSQLWELRDGSMHLRDDAPEVNDGCRSDAPALPNLTGFDQGSFVAYLPGRQPDAYPDGTAKWVPAGAKLSFQVHYAKVREAATDRTSIGLYLYHGTPEKELKRLDVRNHYFLLPAGAGNQEVKRCYDFEADKLMVSITPHMHYRGKDARYEVLRPDGRRETLLYVPRYTFDWQLSYRFQDPVKIEKGSKLIVTFHYDNSPNNPINPDSTRMIRWGDKSEDEMMTTWTEVMDASPRRVERSSTNE